MQPTPILARAIKRLALTTKQAGKDYYKGTGTGSMGRHTKHGGYIVDPKKVRTYVCPDMDGFGVSPALFQGNRRGMGVDQGRDEEECGERTWADKRCFS